MFLLLMTSNLINGFQKNEKMQALHMIYINNDQTSLFR